MVELELKSALSELRSYGHLSFHGCDSCSVVFMISFCWEGSFYPVEHEHAVVDLSFRRSSA